MDVVISGASGLIGKPLVKALDAAGHSTRKLVRRAVRADDEIQWDPAAGQLDAAALEGVDAVINLNGAGIGEKRWSESYKQLIVSSRVDSTTLLATTMAGLQNKPSVFLSGSAVGIYGDRGDEILTEASAPGSGYVPDLVKEWEAAAAPASAAGIRTAVLRTGIVYSPSGGALRKLLPLFKLGLGGKFGSGGQYQSWITLHDTVRAIIFLLDSDISGPVNLTAPNPQTNSSMTRTLSRVLRRPAILPIPKFGPAMVMGAERVQALLFDSTRALPTVLDGAEDFRFDHPEFEIGLRAELDR